MREVSGGRCREGGVERQWPAGCCVGGWNRGAGAWQELGPAGGALPRLRALFGRGPSPRPHPR